MNKLYTFFLIIILSCSPKPDIDPFIAFSDQMIITNVDPNSYHMKKENIDLKIDPVKIGPVWVYKVNWIPNTTYSVDEFITTSPMNASPYVVKKIDLDFYRDGLSEGNFPDTRFALSSDHKLLAVGTYFGQLLLYSLESDQILFNSTIAEGMIKSLKFVPNSSDIIIGELSPDGFVYRFNFKENRRVWNYRLADDIEYSALPPGENKFGIYTLPGAFHMEIVSNHVYVAGLHSWKKDNIYQRKSKLYKFDLNGQKIWAFPESETVLGSINYFDINNDNLLFAISNINNDSIVPKNSINLINTNTGKIQNSKVIPPYKPFFDNVLFWESVSISNNNAFATIGTYDGRGLIYKISDNRLQDPIIKELGTPHEFNKIPVMSGISFSTSSNTYGVFTMNESGIPYSFSQQNNIYKPPSMHPASGSLVFLDPQGDVKQTINTGYIYSSMYFNDQGQVLMALIDEKKENQTAGVFGYSLFRLNGTKYDLVYTYNSQEPAFFRGLISKDGSIKVIAVSNLKNKNQYQLQIVL